MLLWVGRAEGVGKEHCAPPTHPPTHPPIHLPAYRPPRSLHDDTTLFPLGGDDTPSQPLPSLLPLLLLSLCNSCSVQTNTPRLVFHSLPLCMPFCPAHNRRPRGAGGRGSAPHCTTPHPCRRRGVGTSRCADTPYLLAIHAITPSSTALAVALLVLLPCYWHARTACRRCMRRPITPVNTWPPHSPSSPRLTLSTSCATSTRSMSPGGAACATSSGSAGSGSEHPPAPAPPGCNGGSSGGWGGPSRLQRDV